MARAFRMRLVLGEDKRGPFFSVLFVVSAVALLGLTVFTGHSLRTIGPILALAIVFVVSHKALFRWQSLVIAIVLVILFIPIKRYSLPSSLPINLEPYRLLVFFVAVGWLTSLLIDPRVRFRRTPVDGPLVLFALVALASDAVNRTRLYQVESEVIKKLLFFLSFFITIYLIASVVRRYRDVETVTRTLVGGGAVLGFLAIIERNTGYDVFNHLQSFLPFLHLDLANLPQLPTRGGRLRVYASAQHPIALGAVLTMLVPFAIYLARYHGRKRWWLATLFLTVGSLASGSRTSVVMFIVIALVYVWLRPTYVRKLWPVIIPAVLAVHFAAPGTLGTVKDSFFPKGGLIAQQTDAAVGSGRLATLGPALRREFDPNPLLGEGFGTRVTSATAKVKVPNAPILDDQWLGILLETGVAGALVLAWVFIRMIRRSLPQARDDESPRGWYMLAVIASVASFFVSMFFYDAFSFIQVTFMLFIVMGLGTSVLAGPATATQRVRREAAPLSPRPRLDLPQGEPG